MALGLNDAGYVLPSRTVIYTATVDTAAVDANSLDTPGVGWTVVGHIGDETGSGNAILTHDGGTATTKGSMTKKSIRQVVDPVFTGIDIDITQWTRGVLALYHGTNGGTNPTAMQIEGSSDGGTTETALLIVWEDGTKRVALYAPRASWTARDAIDTTSIADAVAIPLHAAFLDSNTLTGPNTKPLRYTWVSPTLLVLS